MNHWLLNSHECCKLIFVFIMVQICSCNQLQCGHSLHMSAGTSEILTSPNFPKNYMSNASCIWQVTVSDDNMAYIEIHFKSFSLQRETQFGRCRDYLKLYDSKTTREGDVIGVFCGTNVPRGIRSTGNVLTMFFSSDYSITSKGFEIKLTAVRSDEQLDGLQSVAAIFGGISFFVFIGLLLCSIVYKRWSRNNSDEDDCHDENVNPEDDYADVIQAAAPPSYTAVMADPEQFPQTPADTPHSSPSLQRSNKVVADIPDIEPPDYSVAKKLEAKLQHIEKLPPPPTYNEVSESEEEWFPVRHGKKRRSKPSRNVETNESDQPPSYEVVTSEGSDIEAPHKHRKRKPSKLKSRSKRTSLSNIAQAQRVKSVENSDSESDDENTNEISPRHRSLSDIESSDSGSSGDVFEENVRLNQDSECHENHEMNPLHYNSDTALESGAKSPTLQRLSLHMDRSSNRSSSYNDLARVAILNSSLRNTAEHNINEATQISRL